MPRVEWNDGTADLDYCRRCHPGVLAEAADKVASADVEHPPYEDEDYECAWCEKRLVEEDNHGA